MGLEVFLVYLGFAQGILQNQRVDFGKPLALFHLVADFDFEGFQLAGNLGADIHLLDAFQHAGGQYSVFDVAAFGRSGQVLRGVSGCLHRVDDQASHDGDCQEHACFTKLHDTTSPITTPSSHHRASP